MPRGGRREGAGKKSTWQSGCKFEDTKLIRVPKAITDKVLKSAHDIDSGIDYELETKSLKIRITELESQLQDLGSRQLELPISVNVVNESLLTSLSNECLSTIPYGEQSKCYKACKKAFKLFTSKILQSL